MNYLKEILAFNEWSELHSLSPNDCRLWHVLMAYNNRFGWADWFTVPVSALQLKTGLNERTVYRIRENLAAQGLIKVASHGANRAASYHMLSLAEAVFYAGGRLAASLSEEEAVLDASPSDSLEEIASESREDRSSSEAAEESAAPAADDDDLSPSPSDSRTGKKSQGRTTSLSSCVSGSLSGNLSALNKHKLQTQTEQKESVGDKPAHTRIHKPIIEEETGQAFGEYGWVKLTQSQHETLLRDLGAAEFARCLRYIDESAQKTGNKNKWRDWNLTLRCCHRDGWGLGYGKQPRLINSASVYEEREGIYL